jgi:plasmid rolling circle replication initiator protein Rep
MSKVVHTLAQIGTTKPANNAKTPIAIVKGNGTDVSNNDVNFARFQRKIKTQKIVLSLIDVATKKGQLERISEYWNTYYCLNKIYSDGNRIYGYYCKNRICTVCSGNRKAEMINKYLPILNQWKEPYFVTLTITSAPLKRLSALMKAMNRGLNLIVNKYKQRNKRNTGKKLIGIKALECNFNPKYKTYNPHFHLVVPDKETADILINEWLYYCNRKGKYRASLKAQLAIKVKDNEDVLVEVIKYGSKIFTEKKGDDKIKIPAKIYVSALHNILTAMKGIRLFDRFGFNTPKKEKTTTTKILTDFDTLVYDSKVMDWIDIESELRLSDYALPTELQQLLNNIDTVSE